MVFLGFYFVLLISFPYFRTYISLVRKIRLALFWDTSVNISWLAICFNYFLFVCLLLYRSLYFYGIKMISVFVTSVS